MKHSYSYQIGLTWLGGINIEKRYRYNKTYELHFKNKPSITGSADATFHGNAELYNPEEILLAALSSCHMMSFFYLCGKEKISIKSYKDQPTGMLEINPNGSGQFKEVMLQPEIVVNSSEEIKKIQDLFSKANEYCFIARSCNFKIIHQPTIKVAN
ncbi:OsmC family protein [Wenyingzhuangia sp. IMCC45574]